MVNWKVFNEKLKQLKASKDAAEMLVETFQNGGVEINTPLLLKTGGEYSFMTVIQLDADVFNYIPKMTDSEIQLNSSQIKRTLRRHWYEVEFAFFKMQTNQEFWDALSYFLMTLANTISMLYALKYENMVQIIVTAVMAYVSVQFRKKIKEYISPYLIRGGFKVYKFAQPFLKKYFKRLSL
ncbi:hypothetical protein [Flammeovirga sp. SJP92]|uniref:hypothetical protein n=1 Tax=Flammeovirga sp. SJP92 TaxID=1775430 RepID=UPI0007868BCC|nr:hypothetical protein [Flammeovirga sp. SJP92]KXX71934.1 hypothetical protein AVL50_03880 [Flammeovirga sp. SJP92]